MAGASPHVTLVEEGGWGRPPRPETPGRALASATVTLTLAILGSSVLPVPYAVSRLGVLPGLGIMLAVGLGNSLAGTLLLRSAAALDRHTYEGLAHAVGGPSWKLTTEVCLVLLLWGNLTGDFCLLADTGSIAAAALYPGGAPAWLVAGDGRIIMAALALLVVFPLSCLRRMRELEMIGTAGFAFVALLAAIFMGSAAAAGFPALRSGELPLLRPAVAGSLPEAVGVLSFAFYLAPMLLPLLREMPAGQLGVDLTCRAQQIVTAGIAFAVYAVAGFFAAARYGLATQGDVLVNAWLPGRWDGALDAAVVVYLSVCMAPIAVTLRCQLENLVTEEGRALRRGSQVALTGATLASSLALALAFPTRAEKMFAVTGATAACAVCYVLPVAIHLRLYLRGTGWWPGIGGGGRKGRFRRRGRHARHGSFSFDLLTGGGGGEGAGQRGLLGADHGGSAAALRQPLLQRPSAALAAAYAAQLQDHSMVQQAQRAQQQEQPQLWWRGAAEWGDEEEAAAAGGMGGHRWTDLSLSGWLRGQSYDSMGPGTVDSLPATTPASPTAASLRHGRGGGRGSLDSLSAAGWEDEEAAAAGGGSGSGGATPAAARSPSLAGPPPAAAAAVPPAASAAAAGPGAPSLLPPVPEAASVASGSVTPGRPPDGARGAYPCLADAGRGWSAAGPLLRHLVLPLLLLLLGVASSLSALCLAVAALV